MRYAILHHGVPVGATEAADPRGLSAIMVRPLPAFEALRPHVPHWRGVPGLTAVGAAGFSEGLEIRDEYGAAVPAVRLDLWVLPLGHGLPRDLQVTSPTRLCRGNRDRPSRMPFSPDRPVATVAGLAEESGRRTG